VTARANVDARRSTLELAQAFVCVKHGQGRRRIVAPLDLASAQAEAAANQEQLFIAETAVKQVEDRLRLLIFDTTIGENWNVKLDHESAREADPEQTAQRHVRGQRWAALMARTSGKDVLACPRCGGRLRLIALIEEAGP
jgi:hypothetical protein